MSRSPPKKSSNPRLCDFSVRYSMTNLSGDFIESDLSMPCVFKEGLTRGFLKFLEQHDYSSNKGTHSTGPDDKLYSSRTIMKSAM